MYCNNWKSKGGDQLSIVLHGLQVTVCQFDGCARYMIREDHRDAAESPGLALASGTADNVDAAMMAAQRAATRVRSMLTQRQRVSPPG